MNTDVAPTLSPVGLRLLTVLDDHHDRARRDLTRDSGPAMSGVAWLSSHLAAVEHAIYGHASASSETRTAVQRDRMTVRALKRWLRLLERQLAGDSTAPDAAARSAQNVVRLLDAHAHAELAIIHALDEVTDEQPMSDVLAAYVHAVEHGPTRPHPHGLHAGRFESVTFALNSAWDRVLDLVDSRSNPLPRHTEQPAAIGRWGRYLIGVTSETDFGSHQPKQHDRRHPGERKKRGGDAT